MEPWKPWDKRLVELKAKEEKAELGGSLEKQEAQKVKGKRSAGRGLMPWWTPAPSERDQ